MKLQKIATVMSLAILLAIPAISMAILFPAEPGSSNIDIRNVVSGVVSVAWWIFVGTIIVLFIIAGIKFLTAQGNVEEIATARRFVIYAAVGVLVGILGFSIIWIIRNTFVI